MSNLTPYQDLQTIRSEMLLGPFLSRLIHTFPQTPLPDLSSSELEPIFKAWHTFLRDQAGQGLSTKQTAHLLFSLKTSLANFLQENETKRASIPELTHFSSLLDLLGLLTFEVYSAANEALISRQSEQLHYVVSQTTEEKFGNLVGQSPQMRAIYKAVGLILENDVSVLLEGETGVGKDVIATVIHTHSNRRHMPFIAINCGAIPKDLIESELFGHEKGSFTGALDRRLGKFELAHEGTLFLDEVGELPLDMQVKLLRVLQNGEVERVGGHTKIQVDIRIIAATNKSLKKAVENHLFRRDLYYRLNVYPIYIPPLRQRKSDILPLAHLFLGQGCKKFGAPDKHFTLDAEQFLLEQKWEGNVRELENVIHRAVILSGKAPITRNILALNPGQFLEDIPLLSAETSTPEFLIMPLAMIEKQAIENALKQVNGNIKKASEALGISRTTFYSKAQKYGINLGEKRQAYPNLSQSEV